ncbi:MAG: alpha-N-arabinofuranosidase [Verrucomicrobia bacterium]|nr:alpha-N-arabinofuranosidase [Verrucomicrobiota bacterium]
MKTYSLAAAVVLIAVLAGGVRLGPAALAKTAEVRVSADIQSDYSIPAFLTGKFAEHLGNNIYNGMYVQILKNPTMADYPFATGRMSPDGVATFHFEPDAIRRRISRSATRMGWPETAVDGLVSAYFDGLACWWTREGGEDDVLVSPNAGAYVGRAQRVEALAGGVGIAQWTHLPLHRINEYEVELFARSPDLNRLTVTIFDGETKVASSRLTGLNGEWRKLKTTLKLEGELSADTSYRLAITAPCAGCFVVDSVMLMPADHINGADPDIIRMLRESDLPILRWPGGNFVSGYHWEDGIGPLERRPTLPNYAWGGVEPNLFGTDEFIAFCRAVGCEPMICVNAGSGTPAEAARWIEYCNGSTNSSMGRLRAENGHPEPYNVRYWEIGNELWGKWQFYWTTASGYVDRFHRFYKAMKAADPDIELYACGAPVFWGRAWNDTLIDGAADILEKTTDHPLIGGNVSPEVEPLDVYRDFMAVPSVLEDKWSQLRGRMTAAGITQPRLAVTELQMFAHLRGEPTSEDTRRLTHENLVNPSTLAEAIYDTLIYHSAVRLQPFVEMVTHSAVVNHGGGLRKENERVYPNPCYFARKAFSDFGGAVPVGIEIDSPSMNAPLVLPELDAVRDECEYKEIDAVAALSEDGDLLISVVRMGTDGTLDLKVSVNGIKLSGDAEVVELSGDVPWARNSLENPSAIKPRKYTIATRDGALNLKLEPYSMVKLVIGTQTK